MTPTQWLKHRTGLDRRPEHLRTSVAPDVHPWRRALGRAVVIAFVVQAITGVTMMTAYSPSPTTAWGSVWFIQSQLPLGWAVRGMHHFGSQALVVLLALHLLVEIVARAYRAPREVAWWLAMLLPIVVTASCVTGWLLPFDQKGYWATRVPTNILALTPVIGGALRRIALGGADYGQATLTRFFTLHVLILPVCITALIWFRHSILRRVRAATDVPGRPSPNATTSTNPHSGTPTAPGAVTPSATPAPASPALYNAAALLIVTAGVFALAAWSHYVGGSALLDAPADPSAADYPARPEWYFLPLFQMLKYFEGPSMEILGAMGVPGAIFALFALAPFFSKVLPRRLAHGFVTTCAALLAGGGVTLLILAIRADTPPSETEARRLDGKVAAGDALTPREADLLRAEDFRRQRRRADTVARRALELADTRGIPPTGALELVRTDPWIQGPRLFSAHCASCHRYDGHDGTGIVPADPPTSSDLYRYATREWIRGLVSDPGADRYFGRMKKPDGEPAHTRMIRWRKKTLDKANNPQKRQRLESDLDAAAAYLADESRHPGRLAHITAEDESEPDVDETESATDEPDSTGAPNDPNGAPNEAADAPESNSANGSAGSSETDDVDAGDAALILKGRRVFLNVCNECHSYQGERTGTFRAPEMLGYGSVNWIEHMIDDAGHNDRYRRTGKEPAQMPAFAYELSADERRLMAEWLWQTGHADAPSVPNPSEPRP